MAQRPRSPRLDPIPRPISARKRRDDAAERVLAHAHEQPDHAETLVSLAAARRTQVAASLSRRSGTGDGDKRRLRQAVRHTLSALIDEMDGWLRLRETPSDGGVLEWLVGLPDALRANDVCGMSVALTERDVEWLVRKGIATLSVLLATPEDQRAHAIRKRVAGEGMPGFLERIGCLRDSTNPSPANDWIAPFAAARVTARDVADYLLALFIYTADCSSRESVDGWEYSAEGEWVSAQPPLHADVHGPNSSPWAVMNWTLRVCHDATQPADVRRAAEASLAPYAFLRDRIDEALSVLPKERDVVFRGVGISGLSHKLDASTSVVFPPFTSTSLQGEEARRYAGADGTFFVMRSHSAVCIDFVSWLPAEAEKLLPSFSRFTLLQKTSNTVLRMLDCPYDIVTLAEDGDKGCTDKLAVEACIRSVSQTRFIFESYLKEAYVEGRVGPVTPPCEDTTPFFAFLRQWIEGAGHLLLLGAGGVGKTSATLAAHCLLSSFEDTLPVFVPLPSVPNAFEKDALDAHVCRMLSLTHKQMDLLLRTHRVVLLLESLDEAVVPEGKEFVRAMLKRNPLSARARILMSCRDEFLARRGVAPYVVFGRSGSVAYMQPFTHDDVAAFISKRCARARMSSSHASEKLRAIQALAGGLGDVLLNPCVLHMAFRIDDATIRAILDREGGHVVSASIYGAYIEQETRGDALCLAGMQRVALAMLDRNEWHVTVRDVARMFAALGVGDEDFRAKHLKCIPRRVESDADDQGAFSWWHKSIGEYLAARALWTATDESLLSVGRPFSLDTPVVLEFFGDIARSDPDMRDRVCGEVLVPRIAASRNSGKDARLQACASNALALACAAGYALHNCDLSSATIARCNLVAARLDGALLRNAVFSDCDVSRASFDYCDLADASFPRTTCELALAPLRGHGITVNGVCFSADGDRIASSSEDMSVRVWDVGTGEILRLLDGHLPTPRALRFSPGGAYLACGSKDRMVFVWDAVSFSEVRTIASLEGPVTAIAFADDDSLLAVAVGDKPVRLYALPEGGVAGELSSAGVWTAALCLTPDKKLVITGALDHSVRLWTASTGAAGAVLVGHDDAVRAVSVSPDGLLIASASADCTVWLWDIVAGRALRKLVGHCAEVTSVCFSFDRTFVVSGSNDGTARVWEAASGRERMVLEGHSEPVMDVSVSERYVATASRDWTVRLWEFGGLPQRRSGQGHSASIRSAAFAQHGRLIATASDDGSVRLWDTRTGRQAACCGGHTDTVHAVCFAPDGESLASVSDDATVRVWRSNGVPLRVIRDESGWVLSVAYSPDGRTIAAGCDDGHIRLWDAGEGKIVRVLDGHRESVTSVAFSKDGAQLVSGSKDARVAVWSVSTGEQQLVFGGHRGAVNGVALSPDGLLLATASSDETVALWTFANGARVKGLQDMAHEGPVNSVSFSPSAAVVASASDDGTVRLWDVRTGAAVLVCAGHRGKVTCVAFSPDGSVFASAATDKTVRLWEAQRKLQLSRATPTTSRRAANGVNDGEGSEMLTAPRLIFGPNSHFSCRGVIGLPRVGEDASSGLCYLLSQASM